MRMTEAYGPGSAGPIWEASSPLLTEIAEIVSMEVYCPAFRAVLLCRTVLVDPQGLSDCYGGLSVLSKGSCR